MIGKIRSFINSKIAEVDPDLKENPSAFFDNDIGESIIDRSYQVTIVPLPAVVRDLAFERTLTVSISIFGYGGREQIRNYDALIDKAICIEDCLISLKNFYQVETITDIVSEGIQASKYTDTDDCYKVDINLTIRQNYTRE